MIAEMQENEIDPDLNKHSVMYKSGGLTPEKRHVV